MSDIDKINKKINALLDEMNKAEEHKAEQARKAEERKARLGIYRDFKTGRFLHEKVAEDLLTEYPCININGACAIWNGQSYTFDVLGFVRTKIKEYDKSTTKTNRTEVYNTIVDNIEDYPHYTNVDKYHIAFLNGVLDINTLEFKEGGVKNYPVLNCIPHNYISDVPDQPIVRDWIMKLADNNEQMYKLLLQVIGYPMLVNCNLRTAFMLVGKAQGGKTKFVEYMEYIYGSKNYSTFDISEINARFNKVQICGKLFNYSDDIDAGYIEKPNFLKRLISGLTSMQVEKKGIDGWGLPFYAKIIMSMNEFPRIKMDSDISAWRSRLNIINFKHKFNKNPQYDKWSHENLETETAISWVIQEACKAINEAVVAGEFCYSDKDEFIKFMENSNPILTTALQFDESKWLDIFDIKEWYNDEATLYGTKTSFKAFIKMFNETSEEFEIKRTSVRKNKDGHKYKSIKNVYRVEGLEYNFN